MLYFVAMMDRMRVWVGVVMLGGGLVYLGFFPETQKGISVALSGKKRQVIAPW
jgi:hypothetical protein